jgi:ribosomal protein L21E
MMQSFKVGDRVQIVQDGVSWGWGTVEAVYHQGSGQVTGVRVRRDAGTTMVIAPGDIKK